MGSKLDNREMHVLVELSRVTGNTFLFFIYLNFKKTTTTHNGAKDNQLSFILCGKFTSCSSAGASVAERLSHFALKLLAPLRCGSGSKSHER